MSDSNLKINKLKLAFIHMFDSLVDAIGREDAMTIVNQRLNKKIKFDLDIVQAISDRAITVGATVLIEQDQQHYSVRGITVEQDSYDVINIEFITLTGTHHVSMSITDVQSLSVSNGCFWFTTASEGRVLLSLNDSQQCKKNISFSNLTSSNSFH